MRNGPYYMKLFFGTIVAFLLLDHASGAEGITGSLFQGVERSTAVLQGRNFQTTS
jgi:hypothetical protein